MTNWGIFLWFCYLKVWIRVGVGQPCWPWVLLVLEGPIENLWYGAEIEGTHCRCSNAVPKCQEEKERTGHQWMKGRIDERERAEKREVRNRTSGKDTTALEQNFVCILLVFVKLISLHVWIALSQLYSSNSGQTGADPGASDRHYWIINPAIGHN